MANTHRAPKQWYLTKVETVNSFENWGGIHTLSGELMSSVLHHLIPFWPGDFVELELPGELVNISEELAVEPHDASTQWLAPAQYKGISGRIRIPNLTNTPQGIKRNDHVNRIRMTYVSEPLPKQAPSEAPNTFAPNSSLTLFSDFVSLDPDSIMTPAIRDKFWEVHREFDEVFNPQFRGYNGAAGPFQARVNMGPVQLPQRKGRIPQYSRGQLQELQAQFDMLEQMGVFQKPEDIGVTVEYVSPSFLIKKPNGGFHLVTAFTDVGWYSKPQPSLMPNVDATLRQIAQWRYIVATDLTKAFYQIPLSKDSMKYCGVVTPFKAYARCAMCMPGSETALEELTCRVLGDLLQQGQVAKVADDLYCGADNFEELLVVWRRVLTSWDGCGAKEPSALVHIALPH